MPDETTPAVPSLDVAAARDALDVCIAHFDGWAKFASQTDDSAPEPLDPERPDGETTEDVAIAIGALAVKRRTSLLALREALARSEASDTHALLRAYVDAGYSAGQYDAHGGDSDDAWKRCADLRTVLGLRYVEMEDRLAVAERRASEAEARATRAEGERDTLVRALDEALVTAGELGTFTLGDDPYAALHKLMLWSQTVGEHFAKQAHTPTGETSNG
jgi:hypothetical protein